MLKIMCFAFYQRTSQIELLKFLLNQFTKKELLEQESARQFYSKWNEDILDQTNNNVLKFKSPLVFSEDNATTLLKELDNIFAEISDVE